MEIKLCEEIKFDEEDCFFAPQTLENFSSSIRYLRIVKLVHLFQGSQQEVEELPDGGLSHCQ